MIKIAICDDNQNELFQLNETLISYQNTKHDSLKINIDTYHNGLDLIDALARSIKYDLIFLDIMMPLSNGIEIAKEIRKYDKTIRIVFLTSSPDYALESYDVKAYSYILKANIPDKIYQLMNDFLEESNLLSSDFFIIKTKNGIVKIYYNNIEYIEVSGRKVYVHMSTNSYHEIFSTLNHLEAQLLVFENFIKVHRSYIVNLNYIKKLYEKEIITINNIRIPVSKTNYSDVKKRYLNYSFNKEV